MKQKYYLLIGLFAVIGIILISGCIQQNGKEEVTKFNISIYLTNGDFEKTVEVNNITLPIDSQQEACDLWKQAHIDGYNDYTCNFTGQGDYWLFNNNLICPPNLPYPCGGSCTGRINKNNGNIENLSCIAIA